MQGREGREERPSRNVVCDALILDAKSRSDTYPYIEIDEQDVSIGHEASVSRIGEEQLFYLMSRGLTEAEASTMIVSGFIEPLVKELPMEYAVEMNRLIELQMEGIGGVGVAPVRLISQSEFSRQMPAARIMPAIAISPASPQAAFEAFLASRDEPAWLIEQRREAWQPFLE